MTFDDNARIDTGHVRRRGRGAAIGAGAGGVGLIAVILLLLGPILGVDLSGLAGGTGGGTGGSGTGDDLELTECTTGSAANESLDCRIVATADSLDTYWSAELPTYDVAYTSTSVILFSEQTGTGCGTASSAIGPFYCPSDETIYMDTGFFDELRTRFGSSGGPLAEMYVVAHEWAHHIQNISGIMNGLNLQDSGPGSDGVRLELQADCFAGAWVGAAPSILDETGRPFLEPVTEDEIRDALSAAAAVGDDRIQSSMGGGVNPEVWTHGSSESRQRWFIAGLQGGPQACGTFDVGESQL
jgi:hypothetical protein